MQREKRKLSEGKRLKEKERLSLKRGKDEESFLSLNIKKRFLALSPKIKQDYLSFLKGKRKPSFLENKESFLSIGKSKKFCA